MMHRSSRTSKNGVSKVNAAPEDSVDVSGCTSKTECSNRSNLGSSTLQAPVCINVSSSSSSGVTDEKASSSSLCLYNQGLYLDRRKEDEKGNTALNTMFFDEDRSNIATGSNKKHCGEGAIAVSCFPQYSKMRQSKDLNRDKDDLRNPQSMIHLIQSQDWERAALRLLTTIEGKAEVQWNITDGENNDDTVGGGNWSILSVLFPPLASEYKVDPPALLVKALIEVNMEYVAIAKQCNLLISAINVGAAKDIIQTICDIAPHAVMTRNARGDLPIHFALKAFDRLKGKRYKQVLTDAIQILVKTNSKCLLDLDSKGNTVLSLAMRSDHHYYHDDVVSDGSLVSLILDYDPDAPMRPNPQTNAWPLEEACLLYSWTSAKTILGKHPDIFMKQPSKAGGRFGKLPFHVAFECRSSSKKKYEFVEHLLQYYPHFVTQVDPTERLAPFMLAAVGNIDVSTSKSDQTIKNQKEVRQEKKTATRVHDGNTDKKKSGDSNKNSTACLSSTFALLQNSPDMLWYRG